MIPGNSDRLMLRLRTLCSRAGLSIFLCGTGAALVASICTAKDRPVRVNLFPQLQAGAILRYQISYHSEKHTNAKSALIVAKPDNSSKIDVNALLRLEVLDIQPHGGRAIIHARTNFETRNSDPHFQVPQIEPLDNLVQRQDREGKVVEFTILADGRIDQVTGLDVLFPEQQQAWQEWASRFLLAAEFHTSGGRIAQKWSSNEKERAPAPLAGLRWKRESTYVGNEPCHGLQLTVEGAVVPSDGEPETCAVILTNATLNQDSNEKNATPEDFKLHELRTTGAARGTNRIVTYISLKTGIVVRATEESTQKMDVTVQKADASNRVHYGIDAKSRSEVVVVTETALNPNAP